MVEEKKGLFSILKEKWELLAIRIGFSFLNLWNRKHIVFPILLVCCALFVWYNSFARSFISFTLAATFLIITFTLAFIGLVVIDYIEKDITSTVRVVTQTTIGILLLLIFLFYLQLSMIGVLPAPPLMVLLSIMWAIELTPYVVVAIFIPPSLGYLRRFKPYWDSLRERYPFWSIYIATLGGLIILYVTFRFFPMHIYPFIAYWGMFLGVSCLIMAAILAMFPRRNVCKIVSLFLLIIAALSWIGVLGGGLLGSLLCVIAGGHAYAWKPASRS